MFDSQMDALKSKLNDINSYFKTKDVIYLDYPIHTNGGDLLIFLGTVEFLKDNGYTIHYSASCHNYSIDTIQRILDEKPNTTILLHGGGNFGDLYHHHQKLRLDVISNFPEASIILFPQTAFYQNEENVLADKEVISKAKNSVFFARDVQTNSLFKSMGVESVMFPDIAHHLLGYFETKQSTNNSEFSFMRKDKEASDRNSQGYDWVDILTKREKYAIRILVNIQKSTMFFSDMEYKIWCTIAARIMKRLSLVFQSYDSVKTSRLHGHIFSCLLNKPNIVIDNSYGKNSRYIENWTKDVSCFRKVEG